MITAGFFGQRLPDSKNEVWTWQTIELDGPEDLADVEAYAVEQGVNVLGQVLDLSSLEDEEIAEFERAVRDRDEPAIRSFLPQRPRFSTPGVDLDLQTREDVGKLKATFNSYFRARGKRLRWSLSSGPAGVHEHGELGPCYPGHPELDYAFYGLCRDVCRAAGLVPRSDHPDAGDYWVFRDDPDGKARGSVDLSPLNRSPASRGSLFRPLGGLTKNRQAQKTLSPGSPEVGSPWTPELVEEGLKLYREQESQAGRSTGRAFRQRKVHPPLEDLPRSLRGLGRFNDWVAAQSIPGQNHELRKALSAVLLHSGLVRAEWAIMAMARGLNDHANARGTWESTARAMKLGLPVTSARKLRARVGVSAYEELGWALHQDLAERGSRVEYAEVLKRLGFARQIERAPLEAGGVAVRAGLESAPGQKRLEKIAARMGTVMRCASWSTQTEADDCGRPGAPSLMHCGVIELCQRCAWRYTSAHVEAMKLPDRVDVCVAEVATRKLALASVHSTWRMFQGGAKPIGFTACRADGTWLALSVGPANTDAGSATRGVFVAPGSSKREAGELFMENVHSRVAKAWISRVLLMRHVAARARLERGDATGFVELASSLYRRKAVMIPRNCPLAIAWPSKEDVQAVRRAYAEKREAEKGHAAHEERYCQGCSTPPWAKRWRVVESETGRVILKGLKFKPTLVQAVVQATVRPPQ